MKKTKLTVTVDAEIVARAKAYAKESGQSLSSLVERHLGTLTQSGDNSLLNKELSPIVKSLLGAGGPVPEDWNYKEGIFRSN